SRRQPGSPRNRPRRSADRAPLGRRPHGARGRRDAGSQRSGRPAVRQGSRAGCARACSAAASRTRPSPSRCPCPRDVSARTPAASRGTAPACPRTRSAQILRRISRRRGRWSPVAMPLPRVRRSARSSCGLVPEPLHLVGRVRLERSAGLARTRLDALDVRGEALVRRAQRGLGVEAGLARNRDDVEEQVTEEILVVDVEREIESRRHEAYAGGALLHSFGGEERWELARNAIEYRPEGLGGLRPPTARSPFQSLVALDALPLRE